METALSRFLRYAALDTTSSEETGTTPSTPGQWDLGRMLESEMRSLGLEKVLLDGNCYAYGLLPANAQGQPTIALIALIAHMDTVDAVDAALDIAAPDGMVSILVHHRNPLNALFAMPSVFLKHGTLIAKIRAVPTSFIGSLQSVFNRFEDEVFPESLTQRELEIATLAASGLHNREIARQLNISEFTVKNHMKTIFSKLDINRRAELKDLLRP